MLRAYRETERQLKVTTRKPAVHSGVKGLTKDLTRDDGGLLVLGLCSKAKAAGLWVIRVALE